MDVEIFESGKKKLPIRVDGALISLILPRLARLCSVPGSTTWNTTKALKKRKGSIMLTGNKDLRLVLVFSCFPLIDLSLVQ